MTQQLISLGTGPNTGTGDNPYNAFTKVNANFTDLYGKNSFLNYVAPSGDTSGATDYANLFAALNAMSIDTTGNLRGLQLAGTYYINAKIIVTFGGNPVQQGPFQIQGFGNTTINVVGTNIGAIEFQVPDTSNAHQFVFRQFNIIYQTQQTSSNTAAVALGFRTISGTAGIGIFLLHFEDLSLQSCYRGIAITQTSGTFVVWETLIDHCNFGATAGAAIYLVSPTPDGAPSIEINHCYSQPYNGGSEALVRVDSCDNLTIINWETNELNNQHLFYLTDCQFSIIRSKLEQCTYSTATNLIETANCAGTIDGFEWSDITLNANCNFLNDEVGNSSATLRVFDLNLSIASGTNTITLLNGSPIGFIVDTGPNLFGSGSGLGSGPAVFRICNSSGSTVSNLVQFMCQPGGNMSDDLAQTSITTFTPLLTPSVNVWNTPLTGNITVNLAAGAGSVVGDNSWDGAPFTFIRTANATGASTFTISAAIPATKTLSAGQGVTYQYRRALGGYVETAFQSL
jgi:hypothetical protein